METQTIQELLSSFDVELDLPQEVLSLEIEGSFNEVSQENKMFHYRNDSGFLVMDNFDCYIFKEENSLCVIVPENDYEMCCIYKKLNDHFIGKSYNSHGEIVSRT